MASNIGGKILNYKDEILEDIVHAVRIPSFRSAEKPGMPFGEGPSKALEFCLHLAENFGLPVKNVGNRAGHIEYGGGDELVGVLSHVDVVPAGEGWTMPPFEGIVQDGRIYGRGTMDDKSQAVAAIYCLKALKDLAIVPKRKIRVILGASEECGMEDLEYYFAHEKMPDMAFTPDGEYPVCNMEKGILHISLSEGRPAHVLKLEAGSVPNMVPVSAEALAGCTQEQTARMKKDADGLEKNGVRFAFQPQKDGKVKVRCLGKAAHASTPEEGVNAAAYLIRLLSPLEDTGMVSFLSECVGIQSDGSGLSIDCKDVSGPLTLNLGVIRIDTQNSQAVLDIRYPISANGKAIAFQIAKKASAYGIKAETLSDSVPLNVDADSELVHRLRRAYKIVMGKEAGLYATGGGSYARALHNRGVAFGAGIKPLSYYHIHAADEFLEIDDFMKHCEICLQAIYELACV